MNDGKNSNAQLQVVEPTIAVGQESTNFIVKDANHAAFRLLFQPSVDENKLYYKGLITFPKPKFFVLYNGDKNEPLQRKMRLSDAFGGDYDSP